MSSRIFFWRFAASAFSVSNWKAEEMSVRAALTLRPLGSATPGHFLEDSRSEKDAGRPNAQRLNSEGGA
jgi:hypothetical protein